nr:L-gulonolactone oxidase isoform X1 [Ciona intestinalis]|eukprot:XP_002122023.1 L-gulonolactone oxidase isoform X1 [Ciona intestinalis]
MTSFDISQGKSGYRFYNWSKTYSASPELYFEPRSDNELRNILSRAKENKKTVKIVGGGLSPSDIACTNDFMISLKHLNRVLDVDAKRCTVTVEAGVTINELNENILPSHGLSLINLGSVSGQTVGGIIGTGTHGSGEKFGSFATHVLELVLMKADGTILRCSQQENAEIFSAACCHLGILGIILSVKLQCEAAFMLHEKKASSKLETVLIDLNEHVSSAQHFQFVWFPHTDNVVTIARNRTRRLKLVKNNWFKDIIIGHHLLEFCLWIATFFSSIVPLITSVFFKFCYEGSSECIDRSDKIFNIDCLFKQYVTEWAIPRRHTAIVLREMKNWIENNPDCKIHFPVEVRFVQKDNIMMAPSCEQDVTYIGIISYRPYGKLVPHDKWFTFYENLALKYGGRPHWAKDHKVNSQTFQQIYPNFNKFMKLRSELDPDNLFLNEYWKRILK